MAPKLPHLLIFNPDQWRADVMGHLGNPAAVTPFLDRFVQTEAVSFRNAFCQNPVCTPSRCSFMSGWYPHVRGHRTMFHMLHSEHGEPVLLKTLKDAGYYVWWGGKNDLIPGNTSLEPYCDVKYSPPEAVEPMWQIDRQAEWRGEPGSDTFHSFFAGRLPHTPGYDHFHDGDWANVLGAVDLIRSYRRDQPLCIFLPLTYPHPPYAVEEPWYSLIERTMLPPRARPPLDWRGKPSILARLAELHNMGTWSEERWDELRAVYYGMCARLDHQFGLLMQALQDAGIYEDTAVFLFADHGDFTGDYGLVEKTQNTFEDCLTRVPFIVKPQAGVPVKPGVREALVELIDFPATVEALTGLALTHEHFGRSLLPQLAGDPISHRAAVFCEGGRLHGERQAMEIESNPELDSSKLYWPRMVAQRSEGPEHTKAAMCRTHDFKYVRRHYELDELYDLRADPQEVNNLSQEPAYAAILAEMKEKMLAWYMESCDVVPLKIDPR